MRCRCNEHNGPHPMGRAVQRVEVGLDCRGVSVSLKQTCRVSDEETMWERLQRLDGGEVSPPPSAAAPKQYFVEAPSGDPLIQGPAPDNAARAAAQAAAQAGAVDPGAAQRRTDAARAAYAAAAPQAPSPTARAPQPHHRPGGPPNAPPSRSPSRLRPKLKWFRPKLRWFFLYLPLLLLLMIGGVGFWAWSSFNDLYRVDLGDSLTPVTGTATNYLIVGSDSREGLDPEATDPEAAPSVAGRRSDTIIVLRVDGDSAKMMSIPRDLWVTNPETGQEGRINATYNAGPANLVKAVTSNLGIPINRYVEVDFLSFAGMVDAMGGVPIEFPNPVIDRSSGLLVETPGVHNLDGTMALAYVRSRHFVETIDGQQRQDPTADLGRQQRQQNFIRTVLSEVGETRNPITLAKVGSAAVKGTRVDSEVGFFDLVSLARDLGGTTPESVVLPTRPTRKGQAAVLELKVDEAVDVLAGFGAGSG